mmetsp:Transcript_73189/g.169786  ORF Transcript_73189/g.169786 Transcript_73189/m.169786 type:complete len:200 (-) Transcript_73189:1152-1751(-)
MLPCTRVSRSAATCCRPCGPGARALPPASTDAARNGNVERQVAASFPQAAMVIAWSATQTKFLTNQRLTSPEFRTSRPHRAKRKGSSWQTKARKASSTLALRLNPSCPQPSIRQEATSPQPLQAPGPKQRNCSSKSGSSLSTGRTRLYGCMPSANSTKYSPGFIIRAQPERPRGGSCGSSSASQVVEGGGASTITATRS